MDLIILKCFHLPSFLSCGVSHLRTQVATNSLAAPIPGMYLGDFGAVTQKGPTFLRTDRTLRCPDRLVDRMGQTWQGLSHCGHMSTVYT